LIAGRRSRGSHQRPTASTLEGHYRRRWRCLVDRW